MNAPVNHIPSFLSHVAERANSGITRCQVAHLSWSSAEASLGVLASAKSVDHPRLSSDVKLSFEEGHRVKSPVE